MDIPDISDDRPYQVRREEFEKACEQLQAWSRQYSGTYKTFDGMDKRRIQLLQTIPVVNVIATLAKKMYGSAPDESGSLAYKTASLEFSRGPFFLSVHVEFDNTSESELQYSGRLMSTFIRCEIEANSDLFLTLAGPSLKAICMKQGLKVARPFPMNFVTPRGLKSLLASRHAATYFCPFKEPALDSSFYVRALPVTLGNAFVADAKVRFELASLPHLDALEVGKRDWQYGSDATVVLSLLHGYGGEAAFEANLELVFATLDLLGRLKLLV
ncbi:MAG: hypothetical protein JSS83_07625 [Cyanobacteria bacterium SZAS LIN-3]|nr:hypothetical protein [Cyanobacteria bacterium SZAS LIN-3]